MTRTVGILLFDDVEVLDFAGPYEVFTTASRVQRRLAPHADIPFAVRTVAVDSQRVRARAGLVVEADHLLASHPPLDVVIVPGGVVTAVLERPEVIQWIRRVASGAEITASVCTGAFLLGRAGLLEQLPATTHWEDLADLQAAFPGIRVSGGQRWIDEGRIVTSAGISAGIDMSLHLVARLTTHALAVKTARQMEFDWNRA